MNKELNSALSKYRDITIRLCECVEKEEYDELDSLFEKRQQLIDYINVLEFEAREFSFICDKNEISRLEENLNKAMLKKQIELKAKIINLSQGKSAIKTYNQKQYVDSIFLSKKI